MNTRCRHPDGSRGPVRMFWIPAFAGMTILLWGATPLFAGLRFGLGDAVAKRSAELVNKAGDEDLANAVGDRVSLTLPSCGSDAIFDNLPTDLSQIGGIVPLGNLSPSGHTFPSDHIYFYSSTTTAYTPPVYAPGAIHITNVSSSRYLSAATPYTDYSINFYACRELKGYFFHVRTLSSTLQDRVGAITQNCSTYSTGGTTIERCEANTNIVINSGELLGYAATSGTFDFGTYDFRITPLAFISPSRHYAAQMYTVCPVDYYPSSLKASLEVKLGRYDGGFQRTVAPVCGAIQYDLAGSARGDWYHVGSPDSPEDPHLALVPHNVYAARQTISYGTSLPNHSANSYIFVPVSAGLVDRDFAQVSADGNIYCYDSFYDPVGQAIGGGPTFILQMTSATTLRFERQSATSCGGGPWAFTSNAVDFQR